MTTKRQEAATELCRKINEAVKEFEEEHEDLYVKKFRIYRQDTYKKRGIFAHVGAVIGLIDR
jgi:hypothetical protein